MESKKDEKRVTGEREGSGRNEGEHKKVRGRQGGKGRERGEGSGRHEREYNNGDERGRVKKSEGGKMRRSESIGRRNARRRTGERRINEG